MSAQLKFKAFERELLNPLAGIALTKAEEFVANLLLDATSESPRTIAHIIRVQDCFYCSGAGEVPESSIRYMTCPDCKGTGSRAGQTLTERDVKAVVRALRKEHGLPILSRKGNPAGYWWCGSKKEMEDYITRARSQPLDELHTLSKMVKQNYPELAGQLSLEGIQPQMNADKNG